MNDINSSVFDLVFDNMAFYVTSNLLYIRYLKDLQKCKVNYES